GLEVLVIDDASTDGTAEFLAGMHSELRYFRQPENKGVAAARNQAVQLATGPWVLFLDDDDTMLPGAFDCIARRLTSFAEAKQFPVLLFARTNGSVPADFVLLTMEDLISGVLKGDFAPLINRELFLGKGLQYPERLRSGESLLWLRIALQFGIPTWADHIQCLNLDAPNRLTSIAYQLAHPVELAQLQEALLHEFGAVLSAKFPTYYSKKLLGAAAYRLLARDRDSARGHIKTALRYRISMQALGLWLFSFLPDRKS